MNKIYKVIWNRVRHCYVVVSEIAKNHGKEHSTNLRVSKGLCALTLAIGLSLSSYAFAADTIVDLGNKASAAYDDKGNLTIGNTGTVAQGANNKGEHNTTIGTDTDTLRNVKEGDATKNGQPMDTDANTRLVDGEGTAHKLDISTESGGSTAVGYNNKAEGDNSTAIGNTAKIINKPVTYYADKDGKKTTSTDDAAWYKDSSGNPTQVPQVFRDANGNTTTTPQYVHTYTEKDSTTGAEVTKTEITSDASKADQKDGKPVYNYQKSDNMDHLYSVTLYQSADNSIAAGTEVTANGSNAVAVGYQSTADNSAVAVGDTAVAKENGVAIGKDTKASVEGSIALGKGSEADRSGGITGWDPKTGTTSVKTGTAWQSGAGALSIGNGSASRQITNVAAGSEDSDAVNLAQLKEAMTHYYSVKTTEATDAAGNNNYLNDGATGNNALAAGVSAVATGDNATAVGTQTYASGEDASAYGYRAAAMGKDSVSIGSGTSAQQEGSVAVGGHAQGYYAVQVGTNSTAQSAYSVAVGGHAKGTYSVEVGYGSTAQGSYSASVGGHAIGNYSIAIGSSKDDWGYINAASAAGDNSIAIGGHTNSANNIAIGSGSATSGQYAITVGGHATSNQAVSIGGVATNSQAIAVGYGSSSTGSQSTAVGGHAGDTNSTAVGQGANANYAYATAVGNSSVASGDHSTALGYGTSVQGSSSTAIGGASAKGTNVTAIGKDSTVGGYWDSSVSDSTVIGGAHISGSLTSGTAIGSNASVTGSYGVALGQNASVAYRSTGVGTETKSSNTGTAVGYGAQSSGYQSAAVGAGSMATGQNAVSLGGGGAWGDYSIALGSGAGTAAHAIALGQNSGAWGENAIAIGEGTNAWRANSIVLGKNSKSGADKNIEGYDPRTGVASGDDTSTWQSTDEAVSIGRAEERDGDGNITATAITRQLNNLAAGTLDTDAVNVAQLKAATQKVNVHDYSVWSPDTETDTNYTNEGAVAKNSMAAGVSASTTKNAENAVAISYKAQADGYGATVIGQYGKATGRYALAFGGQQTDTTAEPANNVASGDNAVSFGERTTASGPNSTSFGWQTKATEKRATAFGERTTASGANSTAFGQLAVASGQNSTAFGNEALANNYGTTAFGNRTEALGEYSTAFGNSTVAAGMNTVAFGTDNVAGAVLDGNGAYTNIIYQTNLENGRVVVVKDANGNPIELSREKMDARGNLAYTDSNGNTKSVTYTVPGGETHSYVLLQGEDGNTYIRDYRGNIRSATIADDGTVTVGDKALTNVNLKKATAGANGYHILSNANATVWGENSIASGEASTAFGIGSNASGKNSVAIGGATASLDDSIALGKGSVTTRAKYSELTKDAEKAAYGKGSSTGHAWEATDNAIAVGNDSTVTRQITGVAAGSLDTDAVNVAQLKAIDARHTTVSVGGTKAATDGATVNGGNLELTRSTTNGQYNYDVSLNKDITLGTQEENKGGSLTINTLGTFHEKDEQGQQKDVPIKEAVKIDGSTISIVKHDGTDGVNDQRQVVLGVGPDAGGYVVLYDKTGKKPTYIYNSITPGATYLQDGNSYTADKANEYGRLEYGDYYNGSTQFIATLNDGQKYAGDNYTAAETETKIVDGKTTTTVTKEEQNVLLKKLNERLDIKGGAKGALTDNNIGVNVKDGVMKVQLAQNLDLGDNGSVKMGNTTINNGGVTITPTGVTEDKEKISLTDKGLSNGGKQITHVDSGLKDADGNKVELKDATGDVLNNAVNVGDLKNVQNAVTSAHTAVTVNGSVEAPDAGANGTLGNYTDEKKGNLLLAQKKDSNGKVTYDLKLNDEVTLGKAGKDGVDGAIGLTGADGKSSIGLNGKDGISVIGKDGQNVVSITGSNGLNGKDGIDGKIAIGTPGKDGQPGKDAVSISGKDGVGHIGLTGPKGADGKADVDLSTVLGKATLDRSQNEVKGENKDGTKDQAARIQYQTTVTDKDGTPRTITHEVATMDDGQKYAGDVQASDAKANAFSRKLNEQTNVVGGVTNLDNLSKGNNVGVVSNGKDTLTIRLAKKLTDLTSVTTVTTDDKGNKTSETVQDGNGVTITPSTLGDGKSAVSLTDKGLSNGGNQITHVDSGLKDAAGNKVELKDATGDVLNNAVNVGDLKNVQNAVTSAHTAVTVNGGVGAPDAGANGAFGNYTKKEDGNLLLAKKKDAQTNQITYDLKLNDEVTLGKAGKDGVDGSIGLKGADGQSSIGLNGKDGISVIGKDGKNGVSITGSNGLNGKDGIDGKIAIGTPGKDGQPGKDVVSITGKDGVGHIGLTGPKGEKGADGTPGKDGISIDITTDLKSATLDDGKNVKTVIKDKDGKETTITQAPRIQYDSNGKSYEVATMDDGMKYAGDFGKGASVKLNKTVNVKGNAKKEADLTDGNIGVVSSQSGDDGQLLIKLNKDLNLGNNGSVKMGNTTINNDGMTISKTEPGKTTTVTLTDKGLDNGGNKITNVADGEISATSKDAVNGSQLNNVKTLAEQHTTVEAGPSGNVTVTPGTNADGSKKYTVDLAKDVTFGNAGNGDKTVAISGTNGTVTAGTGDNKVTVDGSKGQIVAGGDNGVKVGNIANGDSSLTIYDKDGNATKGTDKAGQYVTNLDNKTWNADGTGSYVSGRAATEDQLHQVESNVNKQISDVNTKIDNVDKHHTEVTVNGGTHANVDGSYTEGNLQLKQTTDKDGHKIYDLKLSDNLDIGKAAKDGKDGVDGSIGLKGADGKSSIGLNGKDGISVIGADGKNGVSITGSNGKDGKNGIDGKITIGTPGKDGQPGKDAISISGQNGEGHIGLTGAAGKDGKNATADIHVKNGQVGVDGTDGHGGKDGMDRVVYEDHNGTPHEVATMDDGMKYGDDFGNTAKVKLNHQLDIVGDINAGKKDGDKKATKDDLSDGNIGIIATDTTYNDDGTVKENGKMTVKLAKDLKGLNSIESNSVTTGNTTINNGGLTIKTGDENRNITVQDGNVNMGGNQIHNVAPGQAPGDAVNVSQLNATNSAVNKLGSRVNRVGAGAAALAALHPLDFDPDDKWDFAAGYGNYKDASAVAVGAYYRPNEDTMFSVGGSFGGGENMVNAGVSFKVGQGNHVSTSRVAMAKEIKDLRQDVANLNAIVNRQSALIDKLTGTNAGTIQDTGNDLFPDVPANHWAYEYVTKLKQAGILTGYPDGNFDGDRMMTRYEFAAIVYRAIMAGAASNPALNQDGTLDKLAKEFSPEMKHIRIDTIAKDKNGKPTIERVRVIPEAKQ